MTNDSFGSSAYYKKHEQGYRDQALKLFPWICTSCSREFVYSNLRELTVHHIDHNHNHNPSDGSNWELLCLFCHDHEHSKYLEHDRYGSVATPGDDSREVSTHNPFADLKKLMDKE